MSLLDLDPVLFDRAVTGLVLLALGCFGLLLANGRPPRFGG